MKKKILVVDDEDDILNFLELVLGEKGFDVVTASGGQEALTKAQLERPDLVLLDIMMPQMDGWEVLKLLRVDEETAEIPVAMLSARTASGRMSSATCSSPGRSRRSQTMSRRMPKSSRPSRNKPRCDSPRGRPRRPLRERSRGPRLAPPWPRVSAAGSVLPWVLRSVAGSAQRWSVPVSVRELVRESGRESARQSVLRWEARWVPESASG